MNIRDVLDEGFRRGYFQHTESRNNLNQKEMCPATKTSPTGQPYRCECGYEEWAARLSEEVSNANN